MERNKRKELLREYKERKITGGIYIIKNTVNRKILLLSTTDLHGCKNRFDFSQKTNCCVYMKLQKDWKEFGRDAFVFEVLEDIEKKETQTLKEFQDDIEVLEEIWVEKLDDCNLY